MFKVHVNNEYTSTGIDWLLEKRQYIIITSWRVTSTYINIL